MWQKLKATFHNSETIIWSRLQVFVGIFGSVGIALVEVLVHTDLSPLIPDPKWLVLWLVVSGLIGEALRHRREDWGDDDGVPPVDNQLSGPSGPKYPG